MSEDLGFHGNELIHFQTIFTVGNVVALLPFMYLFPRVPMHYLVPTLDLMWGIFTLLQYRATSYAEIMAYRFLVSIFEVWLTNCERNPFVLLTLIGILLPRCALRSWILVQKQRDRKTRRGLLHWPHPRLPDRQSSTECHTWLPRWS